MRKWHFRDFFALHRSPTYTVRLNGIMLLVLVNLDLLSSCAKEKGPFCLYGRTDMQKGKKREGERDKFDAFLTLTSVLTLRIAILKVFKIVHVFKYM